MTPDDSLTTMLSTLAGRLVTSPVAFLIAGLLDLSGFWLGWAWRRAGLRRHCEFRLAAKRRGLG
jgi:hypothetical protein